jgi:hypothetical protein
MKADEKNVVDGWEQKDRGLDFSLLERNFSLYFQQWKSLLNIGLWSFFFFDSSWI